MKIVIIFIVSVMALSFSACSNWPYGDNDGDAKYIPISIPIDVDCILNPTASDIDTYITLLSGDSIVKDDENATISILQDINNVKKVCLESGVAHIVR